jgi:hypothetical protein
MLIRRVSILFLICVAALVDIRVGLSSNVPAQEEGDNFRLAIPTSVVIDVGSDLEPATKAEQLDGEPVQIAVPDPDGDGVVDIAAGVEGDDEVLFTGQSLGTIAAGGCDCCDGTAQRHLQAVTVMDPGAGRAARRFDVMVVNRTDPLPPGTRVGNLSLIGPCGAPDGQKFVKFIGFIE